MADRPTDPMAYNAYIEEMRREQYPMLRDAIYLDHAGTTLYSKAQMDRFHQDMMANLIGNPHSASPSSQQSTHLVAFDGRVWERVGTDSDRGLLHPIYRCATVAT